MDNQQASFGVLRDALHGCNSDAERVTLLMGVLGYFGSGIKAEELERAVATAQGAQQALHALRSGRWRPAASVIVLLALLLGGCRPSEPRAAELPAVVPADAFFVVETEAPAFYWPVQPPPTEEERRAMLPAFVGRVPLAAMKGGGR